MTPRAQLLVHPKLDALLTEIADGTGLAPDALWSGFSEILADLTPRHLRLLARRDDLQRQIDDWFRARRGQPLDVEAQKSFLREIGYLVPEGAPFQLEVENADPEITSIAGPQLVVPIDNARYAINAANARWGSLYDALYGTDAVAETDGAEKTAAFNPTRGRRVIEAAMAFLDQAFPLASGSHATTTGYRIENGALQPALAEPSQLAGFNGDPAAPTAILLRHHHLHAELQLDPAHPIGRLHPAGIKDLLLESAISTIMDCEDSVAAVDADDKARVYANWFGIMRGSLEVTMTKGARQFVRRLNPDRTYSAPDGTTLTLPGRSLLLVRNVGMHMLTDIVTLENGDRVPETYVDGFFTALSALHDLRAASPIRNSRAGSIYIVKPKMHGPEEVALQAEFFDRLEALFGLAPNTIKMGIMDEERRTTANLAEVIRTVRHRLIFINTGFLDRTGDEIHTAMEAGPVLPKAEIKSAVWLPAYESWNVLTGLRCGLLGQAQIGKGMWAMPDLMASMLETKIGHPKAGANTAWVPSPTAATLHALHYHQIEVQAVQRQLLAQSTGTADPAQLDAILTPPLLDRTLTAEEIQHDLENNAQGILGYVVRWIDQGIGCSKVPDLHDVDLMEDRATLRISSQHIANWLHHGLVSEAQVLAALEKMAAVVDRQNAADSAYRPMAPDFDASIAFQAAKDLIFQGVATPNGYTEFHLTPRRRQAKG